MRPADSLGVSSVTCLACFKGVLWRSQKLFLHNEEQKGDFWYPFFFSGVVYVVWYSYKIESSDASELLRLSEAMIKSSCCFTFSDDDDDMVCNTECVLCSHHCSKLLYVVSQSSDNSKE